MSDFQDEFEGTWDPPAAWVTPEGMVRCQCPEWAQRRALWPHHCEHTDQLRKDRRLHFIRVGDYYFINDCWILTDRKVSKIWDESLVMKFERLVQYISAVPAWERYMATPLIEQVRFPIESAVLLDKCSPSVKQRFIAANNDLHLDLMEGMPPEESDGQKTLPSKG